MSSKTLRFTRSGLVTAVISLASAPVTGMAQCAPGWAEHEFGTAGVEPISHIVRYFELINFNDGSGPTVFAGGGFVTGIGGSRTPQGFAKWVNGRWQNIIPSSINVSNTEHVSCMAEFDEDGAGPLAPRLAVGGQFNALSEFGVGVWNGQSLSQLDFSFGINPKAMVSWDSDNSGTPELYAVGDFVFWDQPIGAPEAVLFHDIARYNPEVGWENVDLGSFDGRLNTATIHNDGSGTALYVAGQGVLTNFGGTSNVARWSVGQGWTAVGEVGLPFVVGKLISFDDDNAGPNPARLFALGHGQVAMWNGSVWTTYVLGPGEFVNNLDLPFRGAAVVQEPTGPALYVSGSALYKFNGTGFSRVAGSGDRTTPGFGGNFTYLGVHDLGNGPKFMATALGPSRTTLGAFNYGGGIYEWTGSRWQSYEHSNDAQHRPSVNVLRTTNSIAADMDGSGPSSKSIVAFGQSMDAANAVSVWDGQVWQAIGSGLPPFDTSPDAETSVVALAVGNGTPNSMPQIVASVWQRNGFDADGNDIYEFPLYRRSSTGVWSRLGSTVDSSTPLLATFSNGEEVLRTTANNIEKWNGTAWTALGGGLTIACNTNVESNPPSVNAIAIVDAGTTKLFVASHCMTHAGGVPIPGQIAVWDGSSWSDASAGLPTALDSGFERLRSYKFVQNGDELIAYANVAYTIGGQADVMTAGSLFRWSAGAWVNTGLSTRYFDSFGTRLYSDVIGAADLGNGSTSFLVQPYSEDLTYFQLSRLVAGGGLEPVTQLGMFYFGEITRAHPFSGQGRTGVVFTGGFRSVGNVLSDTSPPEHLSYLRGSTGVDSPSFALWITSCGSVCVADFNHSNTVTVQDIFDFLAAWFAGSASADINNVGGVTVQDIFDFLGAWFAGC